MTLNFFDVTRNMIVITVFLFISELIELKGSGIFEILDEESKLPRPSFDHFTSEVHKKNKNHYRLAVS